VNKEERYMRKIILAGVCGIAVLLLEVSVKNK